MQFITITDYILLPFALFLIFVVAIYICNRTYPPKHPFRTYFVWGFSLKIFGALLVGFIYHYYYKTGDTFNFWNHSLIINSSFQESFLTWFKIVTRIADRYDIDAWPYTALLYWYESPPDYLVPAVGAVLGLFTFNTYLPTAVLFSALSFIGVWKMFIVFTKLYPRLTKQMAFSFLFIPSVVVWGSGFLKDTLTFSCIGWVVHYFYLIFYKNKNILANSIKASIFLYAVYIVKSYMVMAFVPAAFLWGVGLLSYRIKNTRLIVVARYFLYGVSILALFAIGGRMQEQLFGEYNIENIANTSSVTREYLFRVSTESEGAGYDLGDMDPTLLGMLEKAPASINVTLFRPYPWEANKPIVMLSALEALFFLGFTIIVIFRNNPLRVIKRIMGDETLQFCLIYTFIFAFAVGISTSNFGSLSRYKIPCMPFYCAFLFIIFNPPKEEIILRKQREKSKRMAV